MKSEIEIRQTLAILRAFNSKESEDKRSSHGKEIIALLWVLGEYPSADDAHVFVARAECSTTCQICGSMRDIRAHMAAGEPQ